MNAQTLFPAGVTFSPCSPNRHFPSHAPRAAADAILAGGRIPTGRPPLLPPPCT